MNYVKHDAKSGAHGVFFKQLLRWLAPPVPSADLGIPAGYSFARFRFRGARSMMSFLMVVPTFPGILLAITLFVMAVKLGLYDTHYPLILANTLINLPFTIWNLSTVFEVPPAKSKNPPWWRAATGCRRSSG